MSSTGFGLLVGLGNPGKKYASTRHNIGFMCIERLAYKHGVEFREKKKFHGLFGEAIVDKKTTRFLMPSTFMNDSGKSIKATLDWFDIEINQLLVVVDDIDLPLGKIRLRSKGSAGGHNGLKSTIKHLGTNEFSRLRLGIGAPSSDPGKRKTMTISHVLGNFQSEEEKLINHILDDVLLGIEMINLKGIEIGSNYLNSIKAKDN